jgi:hypothetical protein
MHGSLARSDRGAARASAWLARPFGPAWHTRLVPGWALAKWAGGLAGLPKRTASGCDRSLHRSQRDRWRWHGSHVRLLLFPSPSYKVCNAYKRTTAPASQMTEFARSRCPISEASFLRFSSTTQTGEALSAHTLHHRHHAIVLSIPSTTPPYLIGPGRRSRWCAVRVHLSEASPLAALDRIESQGGEG